MNVAGWVLIITMKFLFINEMHVLPTPKPSTEEKCKSEGPVVAEWLTQDGVAVEWRCVYVEPTVPA